MPNNRSILGWLGRGFFISALLRSLVGQRIWAVAMLTWRAAFRFRLFWVLSGFLLLAVVGLPLLLKDDGTARGFIQIMLTYTLSSITALLAFFTLWLSCGTLARDIEECQMQMVAVKPIGRWQIWLGKLLGITLLNITLLAGAGASVYVLIHWRADRLSAKQQKILRDEIFVARGSMKEVAPDIDKETDTLLQKSPEFAAMSSAQQVEARTQIKERIRANYQVVAPNHYRKWTIDFGLKRKLLEDQPIFLRIKFHVALTNEAGTYLGLWRIGAFDNPVGISEAQKLAANTFHDIEIGTGRQALDAEGRLVVNFENRNDTAVVFPLDDGFEVLYRAGAFGPNFIRGLAVILFSLILVSALGLASASLLSFPVAAFFSISLLIVGLSSGTLTSVVSEGTVTGVDHETGAASSGWIDMALLPLFKVLLSIVNLVQEFSPIDALSSGRSIPLEQMGAAFGQIVLILAGFLSALGIYIFSRRELATAQAQS